MKKPLIMVKAKKQKRVEINEGEYCDENDSWSSKDITNVTTWSRSSTTNKGWFRSDPDEDKDD